MVYLFIGQDIPAKEEQLQRLKEDFLPKDLKQFNSDTLYARDLTLNLLQERLLCLPLKSKYRIVVVRDAQNLKEEIKEFLIQRYLKDPNKQVILILDLERMDRKDAFVSNLSRHAKVVRFKEPLQQNAFTLSEQISLRKIDSALRILNQLLREGEKPERILGGLRYAWERDIAHPEQTKRKLRLLLNCDIDIKTGRLKPVFALEKLVICLCGFVQALH